MNQELETKIFNVHQLLREYIIIHDKIFAHQNGIIGIIKKIFIPMDFNSYTNVLTEIINNLVDIEKTLLEENIVLLSDQEKNLQEILNLYIYDLKKTIIKLRDISESLSKKADGEYYPLSEYKQELSEYNELVNIYRLTGNKLNDLYRKMPF